MYLTYEIFHFHVCSEKSANAANILLRLGPTYFQKLTSLLASVSLPSSTDTSSVTPGAASFLKMWQLVEKFPAFYETRRLFVVLARARNSIMCWVKWAQSTSSQPASIWRCPDVIYV